MVTLLACLVLSEPTFSASRFDLGERLKQFDSAWLATKDSAKREAAVKEVSAAVARFFSGRFGPACRALDKGTEALVGKADPGQAVTIRFATPIVEPGGKAKLEATWAYDGGHPTTIRVGRLETRLSPGEPGVIELDAGPREGTLAIEVWVGQTKRTAPLSVVKDFDRRLAALDQAKDRVARDLAAGIKDSRSGGETTMAIAEVLLLAERLEHGKVEREGVREVRYARQGSTVLRAAFPEKLAKPTTVVIALHGAGGSENLFFEGYGGGLAAKEATRRGWVFLSPRATSAAAADSLAWLREVWKLDPKRIFVMGHSMGGGLALGSGALKPTALALFAPAAGSIPEDLASTPVFLGVGKQEMAMLATSAQRLRPKVTEFREYSPCEHLMIVADGLPDAYRFFEKQGG